jgi:hypothetical protein
VPLSSQVKVSANSAKNETGIGVRRLAGPMDKQSELPLNHGRIENLIIRWQPIVQIKYSVMKW